jgi:hypothetical protein
MVSKCCDQRRRSPFLRLVPLRCRTRAATSSVLSSRCCAYHPVMLQDLLYCYALRQALLLLDVTYVGGLPRIAAREITLARTRSLIVVIGTLQLANTILNRSCHQHLRRAKRGSSLTPHSTSFSRSRVSLVESASNRCTQASRCCFAPAADETLIPDSHLLYAAYTLRRTVCLLYLYRSLC